MKEIVSYKNSQAGNNTMPHSITDKKHICAMKKTSHTPFEHHEPPQAYPELRDLDEIKVCQSYSNLMPRSSELPQLIEQSINVHGFDPAHPLVTWCDTLIDGFLRYEACRKLQIRKVWAVDYWFMSEDQMLRYAINSQLIRRNLCPAESQELIDKAIADFGVWPGFGDL